MEPSILTQVWGEAHQLLVLVSYFNYFGARATSEDRGPRDICRLYNLGLLIGGDERLARQENCPPARSGPSLYQDRHLICSVLSLLSAVLPRVARVASFTTCAQLATFLSFEAGFVRTYRSLAWK